jgi:hypothetical protein
MTNGIGKHGHGSEKPANKPAKPKKRKPAAEILKKGLKPRNGSGAKGTTG